MCVELLRHTSVPYRCRTGAVQVPYRCRIGAVQVPYRCRTGAVQVPYWCRIGAVVANFHSFSLNKLTCVNFLDLNQRFSF